MTGNKEDHKNLQDFLNHKIMRYFIAILTIPFLVIGILSAGIYLGFISGWHLATEKLIKYFPINDAIEEEEEELSDELQRAVDDMMKQARKN